MIFLSASVLLFVLWVITANIKEYAREGVPMYIRAPATVWGLCFVVIDVVYDKVLGGLIFWQSPFGYGWTLSQRLRFILTSGEYDVVSWRWQLAHWICRYLISPWDFNHCRIGLGGTR